MKKGYVCEDCGEYIPSWDEMLALLDRPMSPFIEKYISEYIEAATQERLYDHFSPTDNIHSVSSDLPSERTDTP